MNTHKLPQKVSDAIILQGKKLMGKALAVDTHALIDDIIRNLRMDVSASEKSNFYNKYIRKMRLEIDENGILKIKVQEE